MRANPPPAFRRVPYLLPWWSWATLAGACLCCMGADPRISYVGITLTFGSVIARWVLLTLGGVLFGVPFVSRGPHVPEVMFGFAVVWTALRIFPYQLSPLGPYADGLATAAAILLGMALLFLVCSVAGRDEDAAS